MAVMLKGGQVLIVPGAVDRIAMHANCCCGYDCTNCRHASSEYTVDLGAAGLTDTGRCNACDTILGEYTLAKTTNTTICEWVYSAELCTYDRVFYLKLTLVIQRPTGFWYDPNVHWQYALKIQIYETVTPLYYTGATYLSAVFSNVTYQDCNDSRLFPLTLNRDTSGWGGSPCSGTSPATVTLSL